MTTQDKQQDSAIFKESDSDRYIRELEQQHGYDHPLCIAARLEQNISLYGGENCTSLYMFEAMGALRKLASHITELEEEGALLKTEIQNTISAATEPVKELGQFLSSALDENLFPKAEGLLLKIAKDQSRIDALSKDAEWQPIEAAPKTGKTILIGYYNPLGNWRTMRGEWFSREYIDEYFEDPDMVEPGWYEVPVEADEPPNCWPTNPTHWMPLPKPPSIDAVISAREEE